VTSDELKAYITKRRARAAKSVTVILPVEVAKELAEFYDDISILVGLKYSGQLQNRDIANIFDRVTETYWKLRGLKL
jgi:hypothetical protein